MGHVKQCRPHNAVFDQDLHCLLRRNVKSWGSRLLHNDVVFLNVVFTIFLKLRRFLVDCMIDLVSPKTLYFQFPRVMLLVLFSYFVKC